MMIIQELSKETGKESIVLETCTLSKEFKTIK